MERNHKIKGAFFNKQNSSADMHTAITLDSNVKYTRHFYMLKDFTRKLEKQLKNIYMINEDFKKMFTIILYPVLPWLQCYFLG